MKRFMPYLLAFFTSNVFAVTSVQLKFEVLKQKPSKISTIFVIDNSGSMTEHQNNMLKNAEAYLKGIQGLSTSFSVAVISTDISEKVYGTISESTPNPIQAFQNIVSKLGTNGSANEYIFGSVNQYIQTLEGQTLIQNAQAINVIAITDEKEQSADLNVTSEDMLFNFRVSKEIIRFSTFVDDIKCGDNSYRDNSAFEDIANETGGKIYSLCDDFSTSLSDIVSSTYQGSSEPTSGVFLPFTSYSLFHTPILDSIQITYGSQIIPFGIFRQGWTFDVPTNSVVFGEDVILDQNQPEDARLIIEYESNSL